ncbi:MAG: phenylalanine--tRNA ligase subunit beta [Candidatus Aenigmarchaeota archaeon]|nr:phenylalanine--tRNA ligase subunit beta [Candidatus Aenigmarchaeota archaeon]
MAVVQFEKRALEAMVGRKLSQADYAERIPLFGCPLEKSDATTVHYEVSPNRPDMFSIEGFARAIKKFTSTGRQKLSAYKPAAAKITLNVDQSVKDVRPYVTCAVVRGVKITDDLIASLMQVQEKLHDTLGRKRKKVAIGIHDLSKVQPPFTYKAVAPEAIKFLPLDMKKEMTLREILKLHPKGQAYAQIIESAKKWPVIVDKKGRVLSFPPIINGELTRVTERTKEIFIDVTGTDERAINQALNILATSFADRGCKVEAVKLVSGGKAKATPDLSTWKMKTDVAYVNKILGLKLDKKQMAALLEKMDVGYDGTNAIVQPYRCDVMHPIDIVEDVAIAYGYDRFEPEVPKVATIAQPLEKHERLFEVKQIMAGIGMQEVICLTLSNAGDEFDRMAAPRQPVAETLNAVTPECNICRRDILPSLMDVLANNQHNDYPQRIFEAGDVVVLDSAYETGARNVKKLAAAIANMRASYGDIASVLASFMESAGVKYEMRATKHPTFIEGRAANIVVGGSSIGIIGEIAPKVLSNWKLDMPVAAFELNLETLV